MLSKYSFQPNQTIPKREKKYFKGTLQTPPTQPTNSTTNKQIQTPKQKTPKQIQAKPTEEEEARKDINNN